MKRVIDFGDKNHIDVETDKAGIFIRLYPGAWKDLMLPGKMEDLPDNITPIEFFNVNKNIGGCFFMINQNDEEK